ncbi:hypothetical protein E2C01_007581 [Portunus trituberculatus]|uniref:Uncharacterized protein n=1 Tax=Portunus trituberculatus TaxID=210409 RepID=A0A5B7D0H6_PORTR|nr:hypothetical protein [Portunus trituberculatus]
MSVLSPYFPPQRPEKPAACFRVYGEHNNAMLIASVPRRPPDPHFLPYFPQNLAFPPSASHYLGASWRREGVEGVHSPTHACFHSRCCCFPPGLVTSLQENSLWCNAELREYIVSVRFLLCSFSIFNVILFRPAGREPPRTFAPTIAASGRHRTPHSLRRPPGEETSLLQTSGVSV